MTVTCGGQGADLVGAVGRCMKVHEKGEVHGRLVQHPTHANTWHSL
jgi:hypothetical protein